MAFPVQVLARVEGHFAEWTWVDSNDGYFTLRGLPPGKVDLSAWATKGTGDNVECITETHGAVRDVYAGSSDVAIRIKPLPEDVLGLNAGRQRSP